MSNYPEGLTSEDYNHIYGDRNREEDAEELENLRIPLDIALDKLGKAISTGSGIEAAKKQFADAQEDINRFLENMEV